MGGLMWVAILTTGNGFKTTAKRLIQRAPALWKHIWRNRSRLVLSPEPVKNDGKSDNLMTLIVAYGPTGLYSMRLAISWPLDPGEDEFGVNAYLAPKE